MVSESNDLQLNICKTFYIVLPMTQTCINMKSVDYTDILVLLSTSELVSFKLFSFPWIIIPLICFLCTVYLSFRTEKQLYKIYQRKISEVRGKPLRIISFATLSQSQFSQCNSFTFYDPIVISFLLSLRFWSTSGASSISNRWIIKASLCQLRMDSWFCAERGVSRFKELVDS